MSDSAQGGTGQEAPTGNPSATGTDSANGQTQTTLLGADGGQQTGEPKSEGGQQGEQKAKGDEPVVYEFKLPDGMQIDQAAADNLKTIATELKLPAADAQRLADVGVKMIQQQQEQHRQTVAEWANEVRTDKEFGGDKLTENLVLSRQAIDAFGSPELKGLLDATGLGNHPELVKFAIRVGRAISEDGFVRGKEKPGTGAAPEQAFYPTMQQKG